MSEKPEVHSWFSDRLYAACEGDVRAAHEVANFIERWLGDATILYRKLPPMALVRLDCLRREAERVSEFLYGYSEALKAAEPKQVRKKRGRKK